MLIDTNDISSVFLTHIYHASKDYLIFPETLKNADVEPIHKKEERTKKRKLRLSAYIP